MDRRLTEALVVGITSRKVSWILDADIRSFFALRDFRDAAMRLWRRSLARRSQLDGGNWSRITKLARDWLPAPRILHPPPRERFAARRVPRNDTSGSWSKLALTRPRMLHDPAGGAGVVAGGDEDVDDAHFAGTDRGDGFIE